MEKLKIKKALIDWFIKWEEVDTAVDDLKNQVLQIIFKTTSKETLFSVCLVLGRVHRL